MSIKKIFSAILLVLYAFFCTGCLGSVEREEVVMWLVGSESQARTIMELSEEFTEKTGIKVLCQAISWGNAHSKYLISIAGDVTPDIGTMGLTWGMEFGELGAMVDLRKEFPDDVADLAKKNFAGIVESTRLGEKVFGVPLDMTEQVIYYRTDIVKEAPDTWEELSALLTELKSQGRGMLLDWGALEWIGFAPFLWQSGGSFYNSDYTKVVIDSPEGVRALEYFAGLYSLGVPRANVPFEQGLRTGDYPIAISGNWKIVRLELAEPMIKGKWAIAMLPEGPSGKRTGFIGGRIMGIFSKSKKKEQAWEFIKFLSEPDVQVKLYEASLDTEDPYLPPNMLTWEKMDMDERYKDVLESQAKEAKGPPPVLGWDASTKYVNHAIQMVILKDAGVDVELKKAAAEMQKELNKINKK